MILLLSLKYFAWTLLFDVINGHWPLFNFKRVSFF